MRHRVYGKHLGRTKDERNLLFRSLIQALLSYGTVQTSEAKAKAIKGLVDRVINIAKEKRTQSLLQSLVVDKNLQERLIKEIVPKLGNRTSGYTSMVRIGPRKGDQATMVRMSLIGAAKLKPIGKGTVEKAKETKKAVSKKKIAIKKPVAKKRVSKTK